MVSKSLMADNALRYKLTLYLFFFQKQTEFVLIFQSHNHVRNKMEGQVNNNSNFITILHGK